MAYDILDIEAKRLAAVKALDDLYSAIPGMRPADGPPNLKWLRYAAYESGGNIAPDYKFNPGYIAEVESAQTSRDSLAHPSDSPEPSPVWLSEENRSRRFVLKACNLWSDEYKEPTVTSPQTWEQVNLAADFLAKYIAKYGSAITPDLFLTYFRSTTDSPLRPQYIPERFNEFLSWCRAKGYIA